MNTHAAKASSLPLPTVIEPYSSTELLITWNREESYKIPYLDIRFYCPCAGCVDENSGERTVVKADLQTSVRPTQVHVVGRYAIQFHWSDGHNTGMYHFDRLYELCKKLGKPAAKA